MAQPKIENSTFDPVTVPSACHFWLKKNKRFCHFEIVTAGGIHCRYHLSAEEADFRTRLCTDCHTPIAVSKWVAHLKRCPVRQQRERIKQLPFYSENINLVNDLHPIPAAIVSSAPFDSVNYSAVSSSSTVPMLPLAALTWSLFCRLREKIVSALVFLGPEPKLAQRDSIACEPHLKPDQRANFKHQQQQAAIVAQLEHIEVLPHNSQDILVELGAGKAGLAQMIRLVADLETIVIDNQAFRNKADSDISGTAPFTRLQIDLAHLDLGRVPQLQPLMIPEEAAATVPNRALLACGKHLCGAATDFALRALMRCQPSSSFKEESVVFEPGTTKRAKYAYSNISGKTVNCQFVDNVEVTGANKLNLEAERWSNLIPTVSDNNTHMSLPVRCIAIATCCHHRCSWDTFADAGFFQAHDFSVSEFAIVCALTSWAVCDIGGRARKQTERAANGVSNSVKEATGVISTTSSFPASIHVEESGECSHEYPESQDLKMVLKLYIEVERTAIGLDCKRLLDGVRAQWLEQRGYSAQLIRFISSSITKENMLLLAIPRATYVINSVSRDQ